MMLETKTAYIATFKVHVVDFMLVISIFSSSNHAIYMFLIDFMDAKIPGWMSFFVMS